MDRVAVEKPRFDAPRLVVDHLRRQRLTNIREQVAGKFAEFEPPLRRPEDLKNPPVLRPRHASLRNVPREEIPGHRIRMRPLGEWTVFSVLHPLQERLRLVEEPLSDPVPHLSDTELNRNSRGKDAPPGAQILEVLPPRRVIVHQGASQRLEERRFSGRVRSVQDIHPIGKGPDLILLKKAPPVFDRNGMENHALASLMSE